VSYKVTESISKAPITLNSFLDIFKKDSFFSTTLQEVLDQNNRTLKLKGLKGSLDAVFAAIAYLEEKGNHLFILHDKEEASYFHNDLQNLLPDIEIFFFPTSYKKPYQLTEVENANVLQRAEVLNQINKKEKAGNLIVTYPDALTEKVINQKSLLAHTLIAKVGEKVDVNFIVELLREYDFERTDFVYEAGQYAVRGGIVDVFSFANELPYRIELFGDEIETIRSFDPLTQLSTKAHDVAAIIPDVQTKLLHEVRDSFFRFIPRDTSLWIKDIQLTEDTIEEYFNTAQKDFNKILKASGQTQVIQNPADLFELPKDFRNFITEFKVIEFGNRFYEKNTLEFNFESSPPASFNKDFNLLSEELEKKQLDGFTTLITAESPRQLERIKLIFEEIDPQAHFLELNIGLRSGFVDNILKLACYTDHQIFERFHRYYEKKKFSKAKAITLKELKELKAGDFVTHTEYGIGRFGGMEKVENNGKLQEAVRLIYRDDDILFISIHALHKISKYAGQEGKIPQVSKLGSPEWEQKKKKVKKKVKDIAKDLIKLYAKRKAAPGFQFSSDSYLQAELESSFIYEDTPDQGKATEVVKEDMEQPHPMDRLVCGDVGFGKTEVAVRAAFKAVNDSKQVAVLVPTTILAAQHYRTFKDRLKNLPCEVDYINRFRTTKEIKKILEKVKNGTIDILIGTHRITSKDVIFKDLGLMVIDEEQKFGVKVKEKLKEMSVNVDALTLTATPIPRTLQFSLMEARDLSVIATPPPNRQPVTTEIHTYSDEFIRDAVSFEIKRGGQVFFVHNRISDIESISSNILSLVPDAKVAYAHGQMEGPRLEKIMMRFIEGEYDVLVSTNIIESGLDIPNANTIIINRAHTFGLSDLHQMRGRVGRSNRKAYCYLITPNTIHLTAEARKRLRTLEEFTDLGDGFKVAMRDLDIRGAGNLLGGEQSGFISDLGFDMYNQILEDAIKELKENEFRELFIKENSLPTDELKVECNVETDFEILIPEDYVSNISERLNLYILADGIKNEQELLSFQNSLKDRFGPIPETVNDLFKTIHLRWFCEKLGIEKLVLKNESFKAYFVSNENEKFYTSEIFGKILSFVKTHHNICRLKDASKRVILIINNVNSIEKALNLAKQMHNI